VNWPPPSSQGDRNGYIFAVLALLRVPNGDELGDDVRLLSSGGLLGYRVGIQGVHRLMLGPPPTLHGGSIERSVWLGEQDWLLRQGD
jgi:hypothetical protein